MPRKRGHKKETGKMEKILIKKGRGWVEITLRGGQYQVPAGDAGTYLTRSRDDAEAYARRFGAIIRDCDGKPMNKAEIANNKNF
jgi:hypothetical protein